MSIRVLIIDDHAIVREGLRRIIDAMSNINVVGEAANGMTALAGIDECNPDILLADISMPGMNGIDLISRVHEGHPQMPVLVLSMHKESQFAVRALRAGAAGYLTKDCAPDELEHAIRKVAAGGKYITENVADVLAEAIIPVSLETPHKQLSNREFQIFRQLAAGNTINQIAEELCISANTVSTHKRRLMAKLGVANNSDLVRYAIKHQLIQ